MITDKKPSVIDEVEEESPEIQITIQNIVATVNLGVSVELERLSETLRIAEYNPRRFPAVIMRIREPRTTALIFKTGKMIVTGAKTLDESQLAAKKFTAIVQRTGIPCRYEGFCIQNITSTCDCGFPISLEGFLYAHASNSTYEPELFPGLIYRMADPKVVILIFVSGKLVITGAKTTESLTTSLENIYPDLQEFRKKNILITTRPR